MQTLHWVTCRPQEKQPQEIVSCGQMHLHSLDCNIGSPTSPQKEATAGETQSIKWLSPYSGRMMEKAQKEQAMPRRLTVAQST